MNLPSIYTEVNVYNRSNKHLGVGIVNETSESNHLILFLEAGTLIYCKSEVENELIIRDGNKLDIDELTSALSEMQIDETIGIITGDFIERIGEDEYCLNSDHKSYTKSDLINNLITFYNL